REHELLAHDAAALVDEVADDLEAFHVALAFEGERSSDRLEDADLVFARGGLAADGSDLSAEHDGEDGDDEREDEAWHAKASWAGPTFRRDGRVVAPGRAKCQGGERRTSQRTAMNQPTSAIASSGTAKSQKKARTTISPTSGPSTSAPGRAGTPASRRPPPVRASHVMSSAAAVRNASALAPPSARRIHATGRASETAWAPPKNRPSRKRATSQRGAPNVWSGRGITSPAARKRIAPVNAVRRPMTRGPRRSSAIVASRIAGLDSEE